MSSSGIQLAELRAVAERVVARDGWAHTADKQLAGYVLALVPAVEAARDLHERVEMDESVGVCLSDRVTSLRLGEALAKFDFGGVS